jgi:hypothetical protein
MSWKENLAFVLELSVICLWLVSVVLFGASGDILLLLLSVSGGLAALILINPFLQSFSVGKWTALAGELGASIRKSKTEYPFFPRYSFSYKGHTVSFVPKVTMLYTIIQGSTYGIFSGFYITHSSALEVDEFVYPAVPNSVKKFVEKHRLNEQIRTEISAFDRGIIHIKKGVIHYTMKGDSYFGDKEYYWEVVEKLIALAEAIEK